MVLHGYELVHWQAAMGIPLPWSVEVTIDHLGPSCSMPFAGTGRCAPVVIEVYVPDWRGQTNLASPLILSGHRGG